MARSAKSGIGGASREDRLLEAAKLHIKLGNIQRYCELMVELGEVCTLGSFIFFVEIFNNMASPSFMSFI